MDGITPEMARAELARRELSRRQQLQSINEQPISQMQPSLSDIPSDLFNMGVNTLMGIGNEALKIPGQALEAGERFAKNPLSAPPRAAQGVLSGLLEAGKQAYNLPLNLTGYLASKTKNVPYVGAYFNAIAPLAEKLKVGETGLQSALMGEPQKGDEFWSNVGSLGSLLVAPEIAGTKIPAITSKGIIKQLSKEKAKQLGIAKTEYGALFDEAADRGLMYALPKQRIAVKYNDIIKNSQPKFHTSLKNYLEKPTLENAHWAQSELGALQRHLDDISTKTGLTPTQIKTYKSVVEAKNIIKQSMFDKNLLGSHPDLARKYEQLSNKYKENVIPYTRLEDLTEAERGTMRPKTAIKNLMKDEQFMIDLSKKYPGLLLHTPTASRLGWGAAGLLGYDELKKLIK